MLLALLLLPVLLTAFSFTKSVSRYIGSVLRLQSVVLALLVIALANPVIDQFGKQGSAAIVVDLSDSAEPSISASLFERAEALTKHFNERTLIAFGDRAQVIAGGDNAQMGYQNLRANALSSGIQATKTNLLSALSLAAKSSANIVLVSDGYQNLQNVFAQPNIFESKIFPLLPPNPTRANQASVSLTALDVPMLAAAKKSVDLRSSLQNSSASSQSGRLTVFQNDKKIYSEKVSLAAGQEKIVNVESDPDQEGIQQIKSIFEPDDQTFPQTSRVAYLSNEKREKVLLLGAREDNRLLRQAFEGRAYEFIESESGSAQNLKDFSATILNNMPASQLPPGFAAQLSEYVQNGGGFVMVGGNRSYGVGGYIGSAISELLPVDPQPPQTQQKRLTVAVELIIDKSRSMADESKLDFAKEAAREVVRNLKDEDFAGVIGFDSSPFEVVKLGRIGDMRSQALERIGRLFPAQKTNLFPALDEGRRRLEAIGAGRKHMIILTDGKIPDADQSYLELVKQMRLSGITVSTVLVGSDFDFGFLKDMAERGGGAFYQTSDPSSLPRIFLQDVRVRSGEKAQRDQKEFPVSIGPQGLLSTRISDYPELLGFSETKAKERAKVELQVRAQEGNFPLLASWTVGQGKVVAYTSDANGRWSRPWAGWTRFVPFWTDILESVRGAGLESPLRFDLRQRVEGDSLALELTLFDDPRGESITATVVGSDGKPHALTFVEQAKGRYEAQLAGLHGGRYDFEGRVGGKPLSKVAFQVDDSSLKEVKGLGFNVSLLTQLAELSSGKINPQSDELIRSEAKLTSTTSYRRILLMAAVLLYLLGIMWRELRLSFTKLVPRKVRLT